ncbi:AAA family ATPase [Pyrobaculum sp.]|uniref:AAA family ATPase n=1 Tax=Pyrobaculum sp. TaxID=2004705 RepID=UPI003D09C628
MDLVECLRLLESNGVARKEGDVYVVYSVAIMPHHGVDVTRCYNALRRAKGCVMKDPGRSSRQYPVYVVDVQCLSRLGGDRGGAAVAPGELVDLARRRFAESPFSRLPSVASAFSEVEQLLRAVEEGGIRERAVLLLGPPGGGKSFILSLFDHAAAPIFYGATTTPKGLVQYLHDTPVALVRFDEVDKAPKATVDAVLHIISEGRVVFADRRGRFEAKVTAPLLMAANSFELKRSASWQALLDRCITVPVEQPSPDDVRQALASELPGDVVEKIIEAKLSLRRIELVLWLWRAGLKELALKQIA